MGGARPGWPVVAVEEDWGELTGVAGSSTVRVTLIGERDGCGDRTGSGWYSSMTGGGAEGRAGLAGRMNLSDMDDCT